MSGRLEGKVALLTGGGGGIGAATAALFCAEGAQVFIVDMDGAALERTAALIGESTPGAKLKVMTANVADQLAATAAASQCLDAFGRIDVLVNNASMRNYSAFADATP